MRGREGRRRPDWRSLARLGVGVLATVALLATVGGAATGAAASTGSAARARSAAAPPASAPISRFVSVPDATQNRKAIRIDTDLYLPTKTPAPAVLLAHGFGQDKTALASEAKRLQGEGYVVMAYSARGFGSSGGRIGLDALDGEVADARALVDRLAALRQVEQRDGDPVVGVVGASYGGALALMLGATDSRIDTVVAAITWNDLADALDPVSAGTTGKNAVSDRLFKAAWAARLFGVGNAGQQNPCGRFTTALCDLYGRLVSGGQLTQSDRDLLGQSSPSAVVGRMRAPTLLLQGLLDSLFGLDQADATARQIRRNRTPVRVRWYDGGHDGDAVADTDAAVDEWLDARLRHRWWPLRRFQYDVPASATSFAEQHSVRWYPGLDGARAAASVTLTGSAQTIVNPPGGQPQSVTSLPGVAVGSDVGLAAGTLFSARNPPDQAATFVSAPLSAPVLLAGEARVRLRVTPVSGGSGPVTLFTQLSARTGSGARALPGGVAPVRVTVPATGATVAITLPGTVWRFAPGDRVALTVRTTDSQYVGSTTAASFRVSSPGSIRLPQIAAASATSTIAQPSRSVVDRIIALLVVLALLILAAIVAGAVRARRAGIVEARAAADPDAAPASLRVSGVTKRFRSGFLAVDDIAFSVERGQVVGLLGENGAGKTTTMRMLLGLVKPDAGGIEAFGVPVRAGSPVLRRVGAFVEGPGFLPHLSGRRNLRLFWAATGRPGSEARLDEVLAVADLGRAIDRRVGGYSQGMRQRLAIAQAMLGMPDLLVLDEPTNGLDPPQITALRGILRRYADGGRAVIVSSHLLGEVERTCSHVVVMSHGRVVATGPVAEIAGEADELLISVDDPRAAVTALLAAGVASAVATEPGGVRVSPGTVSSAAIVAALVHAGIAVSELRHERHLEDAFLELIGTTEPSA